METEILDETKQETLERQKMKAEKLKQKNKRK